MLYNSEWREFTAQPEWHLPLWRKMFWRPKASLRGMIEWLETQDPLTQYKYINLHDCVAARYLKAIGRGSYWALSRFDRNTIGSSTLARIALNGGQYYLGALEQARNVERELCLKSSA